MSFGDRLREARRNKKLTQEQLGKQIGVAKSTIVGYEKGNREPDIDKIKKISEALEVDPNFLLDVNYDSVDYDSAFSQTFEKLPTEFQEHILQQMELILKLQDKND